MPKFALKAFATGPLVCAFTSWASDSYCSFRPANAFVASIAVLPSTPVTLPRASEIAPDGTAMRTTSASEASPPSLPRVVTVWPACSQSFARPPPMFPLPIVVMFMAPPTTGLGRRIPRVR